MSGTSRNLLETSPGLGQEGTKEYHLSSPPFPDLDWKATQDDKDTPTSQSEASFWAHTSSVEAYCRHYSKTILVDGPVPKWRLGSLYPNAPTTFSGPTPPKKRRLCDDNSAATPRLPPPKKRRLSEEFSPTTSPCERLSIR